MTIYLSAYDSTTFWPDGTRMQKTLRPTAARELLLSGDGLFVSNINHVELAAIIAGELQITVPVQAVDIFIADPGSYLVVAEYVGPAISFGVMELPSGGSIRYLSLALDRVC